MFILNIESDTKENIIDNLDKIKELIKQGYLEGIDFETYWKLNYESR